MKRHIVWAVLLVLSGALLSSNSFASEVSPSIDAQSTHSYRIPNRIAINPFTNRAVVVSEEDDSVSVIDLSTREVLSTIRVGRRPRGIAIDGKLNIALVSCRDDDSVSVIDLNSYDISETILVGRSPEGIGINHRSYTAVVSNQEDDTISIIDLTCYRVVKTLPVGRKPTGILVDSELNIALVENIKDSNIEVVDLDTYQITRSISIDEPWGVSLNPETHAAVIMNGGDHSIIAVDLLDWRTRRLRVPEIPSGFTVDLLRNRCLTVCEKDGSLSLITLDTGSIERKYVLNGKLKGVAVNRFTNTAAVIGEASDPINLIQLPYPIPEITSVQPGEILRGSGPARLSIRGSGFTRASTVSVMPSLALQVRFIDDHHLQAFLPDSLVETAGVYEMIVTNPGPGGGSSVPFALHVSNPLPTLTRFDPESEFAGRTGLTLTINGTGFFHDTIVSIFGSPRTFTLLNENQIQVGLAAEDLEVGRYLEIEASNRYPGGGVSNRLTFTVLNPVPVLSAAVPSVISPEGESFTFDVRGENFLRTSRVTFNDQEFLANCVSGSQVAVTIPSALIKTNGSYLLKVSNPSPGGGESESLTLSIEPRPETEPRRIARP